MNGKRAAIYVRVSQNREDDRAKPERQLESCRHLIRAKNLDEVAEPYEDDDKTAFRAKFRPNYERLLQDIADGHIDVVVSWHIDRMLRTTKEMLSFIELAETTSVALESVQGGSLDLSTPVGRMVATILAAVAQNESEIKSERHKLRNVHAVHEGKSTGGPTPFGWTTPNETAALRRGIQGYLSGEPLSAIARVWRDSGLVTTFGKPWTHNAVRKVLMRPRNAGLVVHRGQIVVGARAEAKAVCSEDEWRRVVALAEAAKVGHRPPEHLLSSLITCSNGHMMTSGLRSSKDPKGRRYTYKTYRCNEAGCRVSIRREVVDEHVRRLVRHRLIFEDVRTLAPGARELERAMALREQLGRVRSEFADNEELWREGSLSREGLRRAQGMIRTEMDQVQAKLGRVEADNAFAAMLTENIKRVSLHDAAEVGKKFDALPLEQRRTIVSTLFPTITVQKIGKDHRLAVGERVTARRPDGRPYVLSDDDEETIRAPRSIALGDGVTDNV